MNNKVKTLVLTGLFTALLCVISPITIPFPGGIGVTLSVFMVLLITYVAGFKIGLICCLLYLLIGAVGLPVFSGFQGGLGCITGPTGGYLIAYPVMVMTAGLFTKIGKGKKVFSVIGNCIGVFVCYMLGNLWYMYTMNVNFCQALLVCVLPFVGFDIIKIVLVCIIGPIIKKHIKWDEKQ